MLKTESEAQPPIVPTSGEAMAEAAIAPVPTSVGSGRTSPVLPMIIGASLFMQTLDSTVIANALPTMARSLGESPVTVFATAKLAAQRRKGFPRSLDGAPFLVPTVGKTLRRTLDQYFDQHAIRPRIVAELDDSALMTTFGQAGAGLFVAPTVLEKEVMRQFGVTVVGRLDQVRERYFAISVERRLKHPAVIAISDAAGEFLGVGRKR